MESNDSSQLKRDELAMRQMELDQRRMELVQRKAEAEVRPEAPSGLPENYPSDRARLRRPAANGRLAAASSCSSTAARAGTARSWSEAYE